MDDALPPPTSERAVAKALFMHMRAARDHEGVYVRGVRAVVVRQGSRYEVRFMVPDVAHDRLLERLRCVVTELQSDLAPGADAIEVFGDNGRPVDLSTGTRCWPDEPPGVAWGGA